MALCLVALVVFSVMSLGSAKYRPLAKETFKCVTKTLMLSPCDMAFEQRVKAKVTAKLLNIYPPLARVFYWNFRVFVGIHWNILCFADLHCLLVLQLCRLRLMRARWNVLSDSDRMVYPARRASCHVLGLGRYRCDRCVPANSKAEKVTRGVRRISAQ